MTDQPYTFPVPKPFSESFEGYTANPDDLEQWPNSVTVEAVEGYDATFTGEVADKDWDFADVGETRQLVEIDTNYKPTRKGEHPVRLTRTDAVKFATSVLTATEDTFDFRRCGQLRPVEAKELLEALREVEHRLSDIREHALSDLIAGVGLDDDTTDVPRAGDKQPGPQLPEPPATEHIEP
ncbi:hypothetical protein [Amycolatopsis sp. H20-H5]|uniref:hypothetical protein n=1 Tax=Amycolatopsis sp. H20-H5 TaxID=3046309 RepID=UPI002DBBDD60|nr:hypothetical protein [Amycolatopsis sp. H20-H5]MEC3976251.1 hypothetical protein [Amycolatopsis sp. H20-H5]